MSQLSNNEKQRFSILVVDDHPVVRFGLTQLIGSQPDFEVVGEAASCQELCVKATEFHPDVVVMDLELDDATGAEAVARLRALRPEGRIVVFSGHDEEDLVLEVLSLNVQGYVKKASSHECLCEAIRAVTHGSLYLDPAIAPKVAAGLATQKTRASAAATPSRLTRLELKVLKLIAVGDRNKDIAERLSIGERAVKYHVSGILSKLDVRNRTQAVEAAVRQRLIQWD